MDKRDITRIGVGVAVVLALAMLASFALRIFANSTPELVLPTGAIDSGDNLPGQDPFADNVLRVEVTPETVQSVIATLARPEAYSREITLEVFWSDEGTQDGTASSAIRSRVWVNGNLTRIELSYPNGRIAHRIVTGDEVYLWYNSERSYVCLPADGQSADLEQHIPTYEDVLALSPEEITDAGYEQREGVSCIYVESSSLGYRERYWIAEESGLLAAAESWDGDRLTYRMQGYQVSVPGEEGSFLLPDGTRLTPEES